MSRTDTKITISGSFTGLSSPKAIQMTVTKVGGTELDEGRTEWFPLSQVEKIFRNKAVGKDDEMLVSEWILKQKDML